MMVGRGMQEKRTQRGQKDEAAEGTKTQKSKGEGEKIVEREEEEEDVAGQVGRLSTASRIKKS